MSAIQPQYIYLFHILIVAPLLFYIGRLKGNADPRVFMALQGVSLVVLGYHSMRLYQSGFIQKSVGDIGNTDALKQYTSDYKPTPFQIVLGIAVLYAGWMYWKKRQSA